MKTIRKYIKEIRNIRTGEIFTHFADTLEELDRFNGCDDDPEYDIFIGFVENTERYYLDYQLEDKNFDWAGYHSASSLDEK